MAKSQSGSDAAQSLERVIGQLAERLEALREQLTGDALPVSSFGPRPDQRPLALLELADRCMKLLRAQQDEAGILTTANLFSALRWIAGAADAACKSPPPPLELAHIWQGFRSWLDGERPHQSDTEKQRCLSCCQIMNRAFDHLTPMMAEAAWSIGIDPTAVVELPGKLRDRNWREWAPALKAAGNTVRLIEAKAASQVQQQQHTPDAQTTRAPSNTIRIPAGIPDTDYGERLARTRTAYLEHFGDTTAAMEALDAAGHHVGRTTFYDHLEALDRMLPRWRASCLSGAAENPDGMQIVRTRRKSREKLG